MPLTTLPSGSRLGPYEISTALGAGGMGEVYRARDTKLGRDVAIKILLPAVANDPDRMARFSREAQLLASLNHPNIAAIYGLEEVDGTKGLILELVEGPTLEDRIARGAIPIDEAMPIALQIAEALEAAHEQGIIHRDLKPANIKVRPDGTVKVLDFGLAKAIEPAGAMAASVSLSPTLTTPAMTQAGMILGTAVYMSPEQAKGRPADRRTDLWAFGCVLYEMLTARRIFAGADVADTLAAVLRADPDWSVLPPTTPASVRLLLRLCLQRDPRKRLQTAADARLRLMDDAHEAGGVPLTTRSRAWSGVRVWQVTTVLFALIAVGVAIGARRPPAGVEQPEQRTEIVTPATPDPNSFAISPDGRQIVFLGSREGSTRLWLRPLGSTTLRPLSGTEGAVYPFWAPDGKSIAFFADGKLKRLDIGASAPRSLADVVGMRGGSWSTDGTILFAQGTVGPLVRMPASGGEPVRVTTLSEGQTNHRFPVFLPDGRRFVFFALGSLETQGIYLGSLDSTQVTRLARSSSAATYVKGDWLLWMREGTLVAQRIDAERATLVGEPLTVADQMTYDGTTFATPVSASADGALLYRSGGISKRQLRWFDPQGKPQETFGIADEYLIGARLSPDGTRAAVTRTVDGNTDIWTIDAVRASRVTVKASSEQFPVWAPDGRRLVFRSNQQGAAYQLFVSSVSSVGGDTPVVTSARDKVVWDWRADGRYLSFTQNDAKTGWDIWAASLDTPDRPFVILQTPFDERAAQFSPDGRWLTYYSNQSGRYEAYVRPFVTPESSGSTGVDADSEWQVSTSGGVFPKWSADGHTVYYQDLDGRIMVVPVTIAVTQVQPGTPAAVFHPSLYGIGDVNLGRQWDIAKDGRFLVNTVPDVASSLVLVQHWNAQALQ